MSKEELNKRGIKTFFRDGKEFFYGKKYGDIQIIHEVDNRSYSELISDLLDFENNGMDRVIKLTRKLKT